MHYFLLIYFNSKPLHVLSRHAAHHQEDQLCINSNWYSHALCWMAAGRIWFCVCVCVCARARAHVRAHTFISMYNPLKSLNEDFYECFKWHQCFTYMSELHWTFKTIHELLVAWSLIFNEYQGAILPGTKHLWHEDDLHLVLILWTCVQPYRYSTTCLHGVVLNSHEGLYHYLGVKESWSGHAGVIVLPRGDSGVLEGAPVALQGCKMRNAVFFTQDHLCMVKSHILREVTLLRWTQRI